MRTPLRLAVLVSGRGTNLQAIIDGCKSGEIRGTVSVVVSNRPNVLALRRAEDAGIPHYVIQSRDYGKWPDCRNEYERAIIDILKDFDIDLVVLAGYDRLIGDVFLNAYPQRIINIHPSLLPSFPGLHAQKDALEYGVKVAGATVFFVNPVMDGGPIIAQEAVPVEEKDTVETLSARILQVEHCILKRAIRLIADGRVSIQGRRVIIT